MEGLEEILPFIEWVNKNISNDHEVIGNVEKFLALWLYDKETFHRYIDNPLQEKRFQDLYHALTKIHRFEELETVFEEVGLISKRFKKRN